MTALKPIEARRVIGIATEKYKVNYICSHPTCHETRGDKGHHIFPRSQIGNDSYFVKIEDHETYTIPHVTGLCHSHHRDVEEHRAWIKLEDDVFQWYDRGDNNPSTGGLDWVLTGPLDPQPGVRVKGALKPARKPRGKKKEKARNRANVQIRVPKDEQEDGAGLFDDLVNQLRERYDQPDAPAYYVIIKAMYEALTN